MQASTDFFSSVLSPYLLRIPLSTFYLFFLLSQFPCTASPPKLTHPNTCTLKKKKRNSLKFDLPGFIFRDTLSVCIALIQHPLHSLRTICCQTSYLKRNSARSALQGSQAI